MTVLNDVNKLFMDILPSCEIELISQSGFCKYIIYNEHGTFFVMGFNPITKQYGFGRTPLMLQEYKRARLSTNVMPDYAPLYKYIEHTYKAREKLRAEMKPIFDVIDIFTGKRR